MAVVAGVKLQDMKRPKESLAPGSVGKISPDPYSYEHRISLDQDALDKLGVGETPKVGDKFHVLGVAHVHSVNSDSYAGSKPKTSVGLQFHHMAVQPAGSKESAFDAVSKGVDEAGK